MRIIARRTYEKFAKKYNVKDYKNKTMKQLSKQIYNYEKKHVVKKGLYFVN